MAICAGTAAGVAWYASTARPWPTSDDAVPSILDSYVAPRCSCPSQKKQQQPICFHCTHPAPAYVCRCHSPAAVVLPLVLTAGSLQGRRIGSTHPLRIETDLMSLPTFTFRPVSRNRDRGLLALTEIRYILLLRAQRPTSAANVLHATHCIHALPPCAAVPLRHRGRAATVQNGQHSRQLRHKLAG